MNDDEPFLLSLGLHAEDIDAPDSAWQGALSAAFDPETAAPAGDVVPVMEDTPVVPGEYDDLVVADEPSLADDANNQPSPDSPESDDDALPDLDGDSTPAITEEESVDHEVDFGRSGHHDPGTED